MRQLRTNKQFPEDGFRINVSKPEMAKLLYTCYVSTVDERGRQFKYDDHVNDVIWQVAETLTIPSHRFGILMTGPCGNGKTTMMYAIRKVIHYLAAKQSSVLFPRYRTEIPILSAKEIVNGIVINGQNYRHIDILMIDDLGHEPTEVMRYGMIHTPIIDLLESRYARQKYTIVTTNLREEEIRPKYGNRIADRFCEMMHTIKFDGDTYRD